MPVLLRVCLPVRLVCIITVCLAKIRRMRGIIDLMPVFIRVDLSISLVCVVAVCFTKIRSMGRINRFLRLPFPLDWLVAFTSLPMKTTGVDIVKFMPVCFRVDFYVCFEAVVRVGLA